MMQEDSFTVSIGDDKFVVPQKVADVCQHFHNILSLGIDEEEVPPVIYLRFKLILPSLIKLPLKYF